MRAGGEWTLGPLLPAEPGLAATLAGRMPLILAGVGVVVLLQWWILAQTGAGGASVPPPPPPGEEQLQPARASACGGCDCAGADCGDLCAGADCACDLGDACSGCDVGSCDCIAVPPLGLLGDHPSPHSSCGPRTRRALQLSSLALLVPLVVMGFWRRRR